ncbi:Hsp70 family protein, partial [bacterium]|nr:Hsp70 family protein [bacterium]
DEEVETMLEKSLEKAQEDMADRMLIESRNEAELVIKATEKALDESDYLLGETEKTKIHETLALLKKACEQTNHKTIVNLTEQLNQDTTGFAEKILNSFAQKTLSHKKIAELNT